MDMSTPVFRKNGRPMPAVSAALGILLWPEREYRDETLRDYLSGSGASVQLKGRLRISRDVLLRLNVNQFTLKDMMVKLVEDTVVIQGKHELKVDEHGCVSREFTRRFKIPEDVEKGSLTCIFGKNGMLTIEASKNVVESKSDNERVIPVQLQQLAEEMIDTEVDVAKEGTDGTVAKTPTTKEDAKSDCETVIPVRLQQVAGVMLEGEADVAGGDAVVTTANSFVCDKCNKIFPSNPRLDAEQIAARKSFPCQLCN